MNNLLNKFDYNVIERSEGEYILHYREKYFEIGFLVYQILLYGKSSSSLEDIIIQIGRKDLTPNKLSKIIETSILPVLTTSFDKKQEEIYQKRYWCRKKIISSGKISPFINLMMPLFGNIFIPIFILTILSNIIIYLLLPKVYLSTEATNLAVYVLVVYPLYFIILFMHEFGHIAATRNVGLKERCVNFAMYYVLPMLYVRLDDTWAICRKDRIMINLAGIAVQALINLPLLILALISPSHTILQQVSYITFWMNTVTILMNLIPFMKLDGYWILSDLLNIPNLASESNLWVKRLFAKPSPFASKGINVSGIRRFIFISYSLLKPLFLLVIISWGITFLTYTFIHSYFILSNLQYITFTKETLYYFLPNLLLMLIAIFIGARYVIYFYKFINRKNQKQ